MPVLLPGRPHGPPLPISSRAIVFNRSSSDGIQPLAIFVTAGLLKKVPGPLVFLLTAGGSFGSFQGIDLQGFFSYMTSHMSCEIAGAFGPFL